MKTRVINPKQFVIRRQRSDYGIFPAAYYYVDWVSRRAKKLFGAQISSCLQVTKGCYPKGKERSIIGSRDQYALLVKGIIKKIQQHPNFLTNVLRKSKSIETSYRHFLDSVVVNNTLKTKKDIIKVHKKIITFYTEFSFWNCLVWFIAADAIYDYVVTRLRTRYSLSQSELETLFTPQTPSFVWQEEVALLTLAKKVNFNKRNLSGQNAVVKKAFQKHAIRWGYIPWDYLGPTYLTPKDFLKLLYKKATSQKQAARLLEKKQQYVNEFLKRQATITLKKAISKKHLRLINDIRILTLLQDDKKDICNYAQFVLHTRIFRHIGKATGIPAVFCSKYSEKELWTAFKKSDKKTLKGTLTERKQAVASITENNKIQVVFGRNAARLFDSFSNEVVATDILRGICASGGKKIGKVKILHTSRDAKKIRRGEILVAPMTTPDYVQAMKKASAIITDEGGVTSHAAIISRELNIPCVVGTTVATTVLKDGMRVEVNADIGQIRIR